MNLFDYQISTPEAMEGVIREAGIIPFFRNAIPGYSIQELTDPAYWFGNEESTLGPWDWKIHCVQAGDIAYGKFLCGGKASFATIPWYRELMNIRRATTTPDANGKLILAELLRKDNISIKEIRALLNVKKGAADAAISKLQRQCRIVTGDIERIYNGPELTYKGWQVSSFCEPETLFESDSLQTNHTPEESLEILIDHIAGLFPDQVSRKQILKVLK